MSTRDMTQSIMRRKPIDDIEEENKHSGLFKTLGLWQLTAIGVGGIIGVGIFSLGGPGGPRQRRPSPASARRC